mmetsp:Transcript_64432/g.203685  ORF Transcript_64432/g.203685 Transcript_64432/m.203685 type:complete len:256 (+) Transcript_64432:568-1335(+)
MPVREGGLLDAPDRRLADGRHCGLLPAAPGGFGLPVLLPEECWASGKGRRTGSRRCARRGRLGSQGHGEATHRQPGAGHLQGLHCFNHSVPANLHPSRHPHCSLWLRLPWARDDLGSVSWSELPGERTDLCVRNGLLHLAFEGLAPRSRLCGEPRPALLNASNVLFRLLPELVDGRRQRRKLLLGLFPRRSEVEELHAVNRPQEVLHVWNRSLLWNCNRLLGCHCEIPAAELHSPEVRRRRRITRQVACVPGLLL